MPLLSTIRPTQMVRGMVVDRISLPSLVNALVRHLTKVGDQDYFERGIELAISSEKMRVEPVDISDLYAVEIDFAEDLERANLFV